MPKFEKFTESGLAKPLRFGERLRCCGCSTDFNRRNCRPGSPEGPALEWYGGVACPACKRYDVSFIRVPPWERPRVVGATAIGLLIAAVAALAGLAALSHDDVRRAKDKTAALGARFKAFAGDPTDETLRLVLTALPDKDRDDQEFQTSRDYLRTDSGLAEFAVGPSDGMRDTPSARVPLPSLAEHAPQYIGEPLLTVGKIESARAYQHAGYTAWRLRLVPLDGPPQRSAICDSLILPEGADFQFTEGQVVFVRGLVLGDEPSRSARHAATARLVCSGGGLGAGDARLSWLTERPPAPGPGWCGEPTAFGHCSGSQTTSAYQVQDGDVLESIARRFGISTGRIEALDSTRDWSVIRRGQQVPLPPAVYVVRAGETLSSVATAHGISEHLIEALNPQLAKPEALREGDSLVVRRIQPLPSARGD